VVAAATNIFVEGIYTVEQAAHLARVQPRLLRRWLDGSSDAAPALLRRIPKNDAGTLGFVDLIQVMAVRAIRQGEIRSPWKKDPVSWSLQKLRKTVEQAERSGIQYPFARKHKTYLFCDDIVIEYEDGSLITVTGKYRQQHLIKSVVEIYLDKLTFDPVTELAVGYTPMADESNNRKIVLRPTLKYGAPVVMPCGISVATLVDAVDSEGSVRAAADMYEVQEDDIKLALEYEDVLAGTAA
jgi:uncharacterized protein (DUF433 family)